MKYRHKPLSAQELREAVVSSDEHASIHAMVFSQQKGLLRHDRKRRRHHEPPPPRLIAGAAKVRTLLIKKPILYVDYMTSAGAVPDKAREKLFEKLQNVREQAGDWDFGISCHCVAEIAQMIGSRARATTPENV